jgi:putative DNA primase/helicase
MSIHHLRDVAASSSKLDKKWRKALAPCGDGFLGDERNVLLTLRNAPELSGLVGFNEFKSEVQFLGSPPWRTATKGESWTDEDDVQAAAWMQGQRIRLRGTTAVSSCIAVVAREHKFHPVRSYLKRLNWDGIERIDNWLQRYLGAVGPSDYLRVVGRKWLISAVARIMQPGCQADHVLVFEGKQGLGKTAAARTLAKFVEWFCPSLPDVHSKDAPLQLAGRWIVELAELGGISRSEVEAVKAFITTSADVVRPPYGRRAVQLPRQSVFIATTNETCYLRDKTGNRRFWPVEVTKFEREEFIDDVDQLWAEATTAYGCGETWHLDEKETLLAVSEQQQRVQVSQVEEQVFEYLASCNSRDVTVREVLISGLGLDPEDSGFAERSKRLGSEVSGAIEMAGYERMGRKGKCKRTTYRRKVDKGGLAAESLSYACIRE